MRWIVFLALFGLAFTNLIAQHSIARQWNEELLEAIRNDFARPTIHARNLFHTSVAMYDIWSVVKGEGQPYLLGDTIGSFISDFQGLEQQLTGEEEDEFLDEAISYAMYEIMDHRFSTAPDPSKITSAINLKMVELGYDPVVESGNFPDDTTAVAFGRFVAEQLISFGLQDGSNESIRYRNRFYSPVNDPMLVTDYENGDLDDPNRWQPLAFAVFIDQSGNEILGMIPDFLSPEWGTVSPFALSEDDLTIYEDDRRNEYWVYKDPGPPPYLSPSANDQDSEDFIWGFTLVAIWSEMLDPTDGVMWDISPNAIGNVTDLPSSFDGYSDFYDLFNGGDPSIGHEVNPITGLPYPEQIVPRADYARVLAEFWADGPDSETPPGHWYTILHQVMDHPLFERKWEGSGAELEELEYDVKAFFTLGGAVHDAAVSTWGIKGWYDYVRPVSVIRYMASKGQSSDRNAANFDPHGLPLIKDFIEIIDVNDSLAAVNPQNIGKIKMKAWRGPDAIDDPVTDVAGVGWILAESWWPYQRPTFVSPPFAGYTSGHSCFSRAAAEVMTMMTGDEYFPGGVGVFPVQKDSFLVFEKGPSVDMELQWATYRDASDQTSLSRIWGGIHPPQDDIPGRIIGIDIGIDAFNKANDYFQGMTTSITEENFETNLFSVYPTVLTQFERISIEHAQDVDGDVRIEMYDLNGRKVRSERIRPGITRLDVFGLSSGTYVLNIIEKKARQVIKIIIVE